VPNKANFGQKPRKNARFLEVVLLIGKGLLVLSRAFLRGSRIIPRIAALSIFTAIPLLYSHYHIRAR
jgi:hypothetical protein